MTACIVACIAFMVLGRRWFRMPIDLTALGVMPSLAVLFVFGAHMTGDIVPGPSVALVLDAVIFALFGGFAIYHFGLMNLPSTDAAVESAIGP